MLTSTNFGTFIAPGQKKVFYNEIERISPQYKQIFREVQVERKTYLGAHAGGFGLWDLSSEGAPITAEDIKQDSSPEISVERYSKGYTISWELMQDDQTGVLSGSLGLGGSAKLLAKSLLATVETKAAQVLSNGFTTPGYDMLPLFANNHKYHKNVTSPPTGSNKLTGVDLNVEGLKEACGLMRTQKDNSGVAPLGAIPGKLIIHPDDEFTARALLGAGLNIIDGVPQAESTLPNLQIVVMDYLPDDSAFFLQAKDIDNLVLVWRERPTFGSQQIAQSVDWFFYGYTRFAASYEEWRGLVGVQKPE